MPRSSASRTFILLVGFCLPGGCILAQISSSEKLRNLFASLRQIKNDSLKPAILVDIGKAYYEQRPLEPRIADSALLFLQQAESLSRQLKLEALRAEALKYQAVIHFSQGHWSKFQVLLPLMPPHKQVETYWWLNDQLKGRFGVQKALIDTSLKYLQQAEDICEKNAFHPTFPAYTYLRLAENYYWREAFQSGNYYAEKAIPFYQKAGKEKGIGEMWYSLANLIKVKDQYFNNILYCTDKATKASMDAGDTVYATFSMLKATEVYTGLGQHFKVRDVCMEVLKMQNTPRLHYAYLAYAKLSEFYRIQGDLDKAVFYIQEAIKDASPREPFGYHSLFAILSSNYFSLGHYDKCMEAVQQSLAIANKQKAPLTGVAIRSMVKCYIAMGKPEEGIAFVKAHYNASDPLTVVDRMTIAEALAHAYYAMNKIDLAQKYFEEMSEWGKQTYSWEAHTPQFFQCQFYVRTGQYEKADKLLKPLLEKCKQGTIYVKTTSEVHLLCYQVDSARGLFSSAIGHLREYQRLRDSVFNETQSRQIAELEIRYDVENKNKDLLLKDQAIHLREDSIELLTRQGLLQYATARQREQDLALQQANIDVLSKKALLQKAVMEKNDRELKLQAKDLDILKGTSSLQATQLAQAGIQKKVTIGGIVLLLIIVTLLLNQYRIKQQNLQQISDKNETLQQLLKEKEWLVKEVHHRVKNNLQVMLSLLESQAAFLQHEALAAIQDSQHRIQAMSLIHQRLYQGDNVSIIHMDEYIAEMVAYLKESYDSGRRIGYQLNVVPVQLDVSKAVPLGLILNEAITNSIKHAFPEGRQGQIVISLQAQEADRYVLIIADDGIGLPDDFGTTKPSSLGMRLIRGLSEEINAKLRIEGKAGTRLSIVFDNRVAI